MWNETSDAKESLGQIAEKALSVSQLNWYLKRLVEEAIPRVWLEGEISDLSRPSSGHIYLTLKDDQSQIRAVIWRSTAARLKMQLKDGLSVVCCGGVEVYPPRGSYQIVITQLQPKGMGQLQLAFQQLHQRLSNEGLFNPERKKPLPAFPRRIGFVTSPTGAAIHDFLESAGPMWQDFELTIIPSRVQGELAAQELVRGIQLAQKLRPELDLLIVGRGGGSMEDLWCFNEEIVVRALALCRLPTVSAVGHEIDVTLCDLAADARAMTPSQAASLVLPKRTELLATIDSIGLRADSQMRTRLQRLRQRLNALADRPVLSRPDRLFQPKRQQVDELERRLTTTVVRLMDSRRNRLQELTRAADALSPLSVLSRGYSLSKIEGTQTPLRSFRDVTRGQRLTTRLSEGVVISRVETANDNSDEEVW